MQPKTFRILLCYTLALCLLLTAAHFLYAVYAYGHSSIIQFIAQELW